MSREFTNPGNGEGSDVMNWEALYRNLEKDLEYILLEASHSMQRLERELEGARKKNKSKISPVFSNIFIELKKREIVAIAEVSGPVVQFSATWYLDGKVVSEQGFGSSNTFRLSPRRSGRYSVTVHLQTPDGKVATSRSTDSVFFNRLGLVFPRGVKL